MNYGYDQNQTSYPRQDGLPSGSRLAQYMQGSTSSNASNNSATPSYHNYPYMGEANSAIGAESATQISYPFSQMNISRQRATNLEIEDDVSAFLNSNYASSQSYYSNSNVEDFIPEDEDPMADAYYMYQGQPVRTWKNRLKSQPRSAFSIDPALKAELVAHQLTMHTSGAPPDAMYPTTVENFNDLTQLSMTTASAMEPAAGRCMPDTAYRAVKTTDGQTYCIRRVASLKPLTQKQIMSCENWKRITHSSIAQLREVVPTRAFGDYSYLFVYDFITRSQSLKSYCFGRAPNESFNMLAKCLPAGQKYGGLHELQIWSFIIQLSSAIRHIHSSGLAVRFLDFSRVLIHGKNRIFLNGCGISDFQFAEGGGKTTIVTQQVEDLRNFGKIIFILAVGKLNAGNAENIQSSMQYMDSHYSMDLRNLAHMTYYAKTGSNTLSTINEIMPMIGARFYGHIESLHLNNDFLENELSKEMENGRLLRILCKLNTVNERADPNMEPWSETGDRYLLKLFRDYIFHQVGVNGKPWIDLSHICTCLNKLDAGVSDTVQLVSRDGDNVLIVSYAELRRGLETSFAALMSPQFSMSAPMGGMPRQNAITVMDPMSGPHGEMNKGVNSLFVAPHVMGQTAMVGNPAMAYIPQPPLPSFVPPKPPKRPLMIREASGGDAAKSSEGNPTSD